MNIPVAVAVAYGPVEYGGLEIPHTYTLQDQLQILYLIKTARWDETVANDLLTTLDNVQLLTGFVSPILECTDIPIKYVDQGLLISLRERMGEIQAGVWLEKSWTPSLQQDGDSSIMERLSTLEGVTTGQLKQANAIRLYLRVITIADLTHPSRQFIPADTLGGDFQAGTDLEWPHQLYPPNRAWTTFRRLVKAAFCAKVPSYQRASHSLDLDTPLGLCHAVERNTWWESYITEDCLFYRGVDIDAQIQRFRKRGHGFYTYDFDVDKVPLDSYPINQQHVGENEWVDHGTGTGELWTHRRFRPKPTDTTQQPPPPGKTVNSTLDPSWQARLIGGSDGSVHLRERVAAAAWLISSDKNHFKSACYLMCDINSCSSYRAELKGICWTLKLKDIEYICMTPTEVEQWCDNERSVWASEHAPK